MLINTLYLFLRELLPVFFCCTMLYAIIAGEKSFYRFISLSLGYGLSICIGLLLFIDPISQLADGTGIELLFLSSSALQLLLFISAILMLSIANIKTSCRFFMASLIIFSSSSLLNFFIFFSTLWSQQDFSHPLMLGTLIGAGLSTSLAVLLFFFLHWIRSPLPLTLIIVPAIFFSGQFANSVNLLAQIGLIESQTAWSTASWLPDEQAVAQILSGLIGYEATPSRIQIFTYLFCLLALLAMIVSRRKDLKSFLAPSEAGQ